MSVWKVKMIFILSMPADIELGFVHDHPSSITVMLTRKKNSLQLFLVGLNSFLVEIPMPSR